MFGDRTLYLDSATSRRQGAGEFHQKGIADGLDLLSLVIGEKRAQHPPMVLQQLQGQTLVLLGQSAVTNNVGEHDGGKPAPWGMTNMSLFSRQFRPAFVGSEPPAEHL